MELTGNAEMKVGDSQMLKLNVKTENTKESFTWTSSDESIATVNENGKVTGVKPGTATITVKAEENSVQNQIDIKDF